MKDEAMNFINDVQASRQALVKSRTAQL